MSFCENCIDPEMCICNIPIPTLERQTNQVGPRDACLDDGHEQCDDEPCASCLDRWEYDLECLLCLDEIDGMTAYHIANHQKMIHAGKLRKARKAYLDAYDQLVDAACFKEFQQLRRARQAEESDFPTMPTMCERQTNDHPINYQAPQPKCLVKNCSCEGGTGIAHLVKVVNGEVVPM